MPPPSINSAVSALRFFFMVTFTVTLDRPDLARRLTVVPPPRRLPVVLSVEEVMLLLQAAPGPKYGAAFATVYGARLRVSEVVALKVGDVDSARMLLRVERARGARACPAKAEDRHAMLSPQLLELLRTWWREGRCDLPVQGLPPQRAGALPHTDAQPRRVHQALLLAPRSAEGISSHPPLQLLASAGGKANIARAKELMAAPMPTGDPPAADTADLDATTDHRPPYPCCGGRMIIVEVVARDGAPRGPPSSGAGITM